MGKHTATPGGLLYVISAPSGAGKTSLIKALLASHPDLHVSVSHTTRARRADEKAGEDYHFVSEAEFLRLVDNDLFLEYARVFDHFYGTSKQWVAQQLHNHQDIILEIDWQGAQQVRRLLPEAVAIFILPPSLAALAQRLAVRGDDAATIERRMNEARGDIQHYREYDYLIINDDFEQARQTLMAIVAASKHSYRQQGSYFDLVVEQLLLADR